jgi:hypothetical protein
MAWNAAVAATKAVKGAIRDLPSLAVGGGHASLGGGGGGSSDGGGGSSGGGSTSGGVGGLAALGGGHGNDELLGATIEVGRRTVVVERALSAGAFAQVYAARDVADGRLLALKRVHVSGGEMLGQVKQEVRFMVRGHATVHVAVGLGAPRR